MKESHSFTKQLVWETYVGKLYSGKCYTVGCQEWLTPFCFHLSVDPIDSSKPICARCKSKTLKHGSFRLWNLRFQTKVRNQEPDSPCDWTPQNNRAMQLQTEWETLNGTTYSVACANPDCTRVCTVFDYMCSSTGHCRVCQPTTKTCMPRSISFSRSKIRPIG